MKNFLQKNLLIALFFVSTSGVCEVRQLEQNLFIAGVPSQQLEYFASPSQRGRQRQQNWCWAASVQMVLNYHGLYVEQEQIVNKIYGRLVDRPATGDQIMAALTGWAPDNRGRASSIHATRMVMSGEQIVQGLNNRWPLIVGLKNPNGGVGHAVVVTAAYFSYGNNGEVVIRGVRIRDPWPDSPSMQELSAREFFTRMFFLAEVRVIRH